MERKTIGVGINNKALVGGDSFENCCEGGERVKGRRRSDDDDDTEFVCWG